MFDLFIVLVQFRMPSHLHLMTETKASEDVLGHICLTYSPSEESNAAVKSTDSYERRKRVTQLLADVVQNSRLPLTAHV